MSPEHHLIAVPGLGGTNGLFEHTIHSWQKFGLSTHVYDMQWLDTNENFVTKLTGLLALIDQLSTIPLHSHYTGQANKVLGPTVSLLGSSAGGSAVIHALAKRPHIYRVVNVCGRLSEGQGLTPSLEQSAKRSPTFKESVLTLAHEISTFDATARSKVLTIRSFGDQLVPLETVTLQGATNEQIKSVEHMTSIGLALTIYRNTILNFLLTN